MHVDPDMVEKLITGWIKFAACHAAGEIFSGIIH
jgi:hypothetical protein